MRHSNNVCGPLLRPARPPCRRSSRRSACPVGAASAVAPPAHRKSPGRPARGSRIVDCEVSLSVELERGAEPDDVDSGAQGVPHTVRIDVSLAAEELVLIVDAGDVVDEAARGPDLLE